LALSTAPRTNPFFSDGLLFQNTSTVGNDVIANPGGATDFGDTSTAGSTTWQQILGLRFVARRTQQEDSAKNEAEMSAAIGPPKLTPIAVSMARCALVIFAP
jgi:hypothetical protein